MKAATLTPLGEKLRQLREARGVTQAEMADALDVSSAYLSALEHGKRGLPNWAFVQRIVGYFNLIWDDADELETLAFLSHPRVVVDTVYLSANATRLANLFAQRIGHLSANDCVYLENVIEMLIEGAAPALEPAKRKRAGQGDGSKSG
ncbi:MAG: helix-turn-helix transcriptional regulator [Hyphomicrobiales bacterium]|jgi:transcriptional regulator with XRE-family HTH domain